MADMDRVQYYCLLTVEMSHWVKPSWLLLAKQRQTLAKAVF